MKSILILGQRVDCITFQQVVHIIQGAVDKRISIPLFLFPINIHILVELHNHPEIKQQVERGKVLFADGVPILWFSRFSSQRLPERVSGTDLVEVLLKKKYQIFLVGSTIKTLQKIQKKYPHSVIGIYSPPFGKQWTKKIDQVIVNKIKRLKPDILLIGVSPLKQEKWLLEHRKKLQCNVAIPVGSAFDILARITPRAPRLLRNHGGEWIWRIYLEPQRLLKRYMQDLWNLLSIIIQQR